MLGICADRKSGTSTGRCLDKIIISGTQPQLVISCRPCQPNRPVCVSLGKKKKKKNQRQVFSRQCSYVNVCILVCVSVCKCVCVQDAIEPRCEKTGLLRPGLTQTGLYSHRKWLEAGIFEFR